MGCLFSFNFLCYLNPELAKQGERDDCLIYMWHWTSVMFCLVLGVTLGHTGKLESVHRKVIMKMTNLEAVPNEGRAY